MIYKYLQEFDKKYGKDKKISPRDEGINVTINGEFKDTGNFWNIDSEMKSEEYYKWRFVYAMIKSGLFNYEYIGTEINLPKGNVGKGKQRKGGHQELDIAIFDDRKWLGEYQNYKKDSRNIASMDFLLNHLIGVIEFEKEGSEINLEIKKKIQSQLLEPMKSSQSNFVFGAYCNKNIILMFKRSKGDTKPRRYYKEREDEYKNLEDSYINADSFNTLPNFDEIKAAKEKTITRVNRSLSDLIEMTDEKFQDILEKIIKEADRTKRSVLEALVHLLAIKIYDEKQYYGSKKYILQFYLTKDEFKEFRTKSISKLNEGKAKEFLDRYYGLLNATKAKYNKIFEGGADKLGVIKDLKESIFRFSKKDIDFLVFLFYIFQDYKLLDSKNENFNHIIFTNFGDTLDKTNRAQFITPVKIINFIISICNPKEHDVVCDPCCGIGDFLAIAQKNTGMKMNDKNLYGADIDGKILSIALLNLILNGDGNANLIETNALWNKFKEQINTHDEIIVPLESKIHYNGNWERPCTNGARIKNFSLVLTNPPFGKGRRLDTRGIEDEAKMYELFNIYNKRGIKEKIDLGVLFLENAYRILAKGGRMGIVLSNSIASIPHWSFVRDWIISKMRLVALFDMPEKTFGDTGVNVSVIVGYKPTDSDIEDGILEKDYSVFVRDIRNVGYEISKSNIKGVRFKPVYKYDGKTYERKGILEDFTEADREFQDWIRFQEEAVQNVFMKKD